MRGQHAPQLILSLFLLLMMAVAARVGIPLGAAIGDALVRLVMNGVLVLSLLPMINAGVGINFGLPLGILAGLLGMCLAVNWRLTGLGGFLAAMGLATPIAVAFGLGYARLLHRVRSREEIAAVFAGFSAVSLANLFWATAPFSNPVMLWPIGGAGMRPTIGLKGYFGKVLTDALSLPIAGVTVPLGLLGAFAILCALVALFFRTKLGKATLAVGENERFAVLAGIDVPGVQRVAVVLSTVLGAWGICIYAQGFGFIELYDAPLMMAFPAASAILIGGAIGGRATLGHVVVGTTLLQTIYVLSAPIANAVLVPELAEILRMLVTNLVILYALMHRTAQP